MAGEEGGVDNDLRSEGLYPDRLQVVVENGGCGFRFGVIITSTLVIWGKGGLYASMLEVLIV